MRPDVAKETSLDHPLLGLALQQDLDALSAAILAEERAERVADRAYSAPLKAELDKMRHLRMSKE